MESDEQGLFFRYKEPKESQRAQNILAPDLAKRESH
jgi:hypothetical protein